MLRNYSYLNTGLTIVYNGKRFASKNGLLDLLNEATTSEPLYPIVHLKEEDIEIAFTHIEQYGEEYYSFVNGQHTIQGGTHQSAFREAFGKTIKEYYNKNGMELSDIRSGLVAAVAVSVQDPVFESQTKVKLGSKDMGPEGPTIAKFVGDFVKKEVDVNGVDDLKDDFLDLLDLDLVEDIDGKYKYLAMPWVRLNDHEGEYAIWAEVLEDNTTIAAKVEDTHTKFVIADAVNGIYIQDYLDGDEDKIYDDIECFIDDLRTGNKMAIEYKEEYIELIEKAGYGINHDI
jgi:hypothetical protein